MNIQSRIYTEIENTLETDFKFWDMFKREPKLHLNYSEKFNIHFEKKSINENHTLKSPTIIYDLIKKNFLFFLENYNVESSFFILYDIDVSNNLNDMETYFNSILYKQSLVGTARRKNDGIYFYYNIHHKIIIFYL